VYQVSWLCLSFQYDVFFPYFKTPFAPCHPLWTSLSDLKNSLGLQFPHLYNEAMELDLMVMIHWLSLSVSVFPNTPHGWHNLSKVSHYTSDYLPLWKWESICSLGKWIPQIILAPTLKSLCLIISKTFSYPWHSDLLLELIKINLRTLENIQDKNHNFGNCSHLTASNRMPNIKGLK
jgi:hypothetical protein